ncbi:MAG: aspartate-semialdehyde dehydrogenase [Deltaproteobacteria bacterium RIFCSPLOWO2_12_FULL_44_12]|nr:MAG: aspartate-semialdehyde dehydrogenase [Deltaproteobacteria bacterium RIFCSPHIGHO2_01_FULL_43_49]OGQ16291.1 MAG: aspartate-semialdehyde dehydrogenase [Deltaproteobacteria bacterium RIFCSPHIGHO2_02_FULL_44_53]OGQ29251.1 MAG: aspartate-semialdehyde dehydrogenase [Deltaproteobacteria bacterium RIFCSPHIGHO2_12_FULL_44_21]OGQ32808.1 MAG: aspartate-semialdehyde dehydrogenase [Deltaproteobacteria bacterium RIFCSPLOWO2_01_FULL_45_74]OGQ41909.1 MAG: aspartate-semialdehyde dehydrogenase [Deltaprote
MPKKSWNIAIVGVTGAVGCELLKILEERKFPVGSLKLFASEDSLGKTLTYDGHDFPVDSLKKGCFKGSEIAFFSAGSTISKEFVPQAAEAGAVVIDNTAQFRMDKDVPLVVPEVNAHAIADYKKRRIIANPNCSTIQLVVVLKALMKKAPIKRVVVSTYQSVSGAGIEAMEELSKQTVALFSNTKMEQKVFPHRIAFNCIPHIDVFLEDGYSKEESKMMKETSKILEKEVPMTATTVRVPVFYSHSESVNVEFTSKITREEAFALLRNAEGVELVDNLSENLYPLATDAAGEDPVYVGRIREDKSVPFGLNMWIVADNIRKGAALNAVQIAEILIQKYL